MSAPIVYSLEQINTLTIEEFVKVLGPIFEESPWVAEETFPFGPFPSVSALYRTMVGIVRRASEKEILTLLRAHPDLATRLRISELSTEEQQGAGLTGLTPPEYEAFAVMNAAYREAFGFPFILAVRGKSKEDILKSMKERVNCQPEEERERALLEAERIAWFRLQDLVRGPC